jgi:hypothetical protein
MTAYNHGWLENLYIRNEVETGYDEKYISYDEREAIKKAYPAGFYTPNFFIRIGLFILTLIIAAFSFGLLTLLFLSAVSEQVFGGLLVFMAIVMHATLEFMVKKKHHYRSGVDDALLVLSGSCIVGGLNLIFTISSLGNSLIIFCISVFFVLRFVDMLMSAIATLSFLSIVFLADIKLGSFAKSTAPFLMMAVAIIMYVIAKRQIKKISHRVYVNCILITEIISLTCFYLAGNYYVVREASNSMFDLNLNDNDSIPSGWLFWTFTIAIPFMYVLRGIQKKDAVLIRVGLLLIAAMVFTIRYYYQITNTETEMTLGGMLLIGVAYALMKYLKKPTHGFTYEELADKNLIDKLNVEAVVIAETYGSSPAVKSDNLFGGGTGGGGGATGEF